MGEAVKLNLGAGDTRIDGYTPLDGKDGQLIYPLAYDDESVDVIRASHVLEHFPHGQVGDVLRDWVRALKPGGQLRLAVPNFQWIAERYLAGAPIPVQGYVMGGQVNGADFHKTIFDEDALREEMQAAGLIQIKRWQSEIQDCAALPVSLNLIGTKPDGAVELGRALRVAAAMSVPRLGFMDNYFCAFQALVPLGIKLRKHTGAFWGQCLERCIEEWLGEGVDWILTVDYDSIFTREHVERLLELAQHYEDVDAIAPVQIHRTKGKALFTIRSDNERNVAELDRSAFDSDLLRIHTAHFGLTLIRAGALARLSKPWFKEQPDAAGGWGEGRIDPDVWFWRQWEAAGNTLYLANRVPIGHAELMVRWPDENFEAVYQHPSEFYESGPPAEVWK